MSISEFVQIFLSICGGVSIIGGATMATAVDMQPRRLLRQTFREDLITPQ